MVRKKIKNLEKKPVFLQKTGFFFNYQIAILNALGFREGKRVKPYAVEYNGIIPETG